MHPLVQVVLAVCSGLALTAAFPTWDFDLLAWVALTPLLAVLSRVSPVQGVGLGWCAGFIFFSTLLPWLTHTMTTYSTLSLPLALLVLFGLAATLGGYVALFSWAQALLCRRLGPDGLLLAPPLWVAIEWLRGHLFTGFPWGLLGYSQYGELRLIQIAAWTGVYGVSFLLVLVNATVALAVVQGVKWSPSYQRATMEIYVGLTRQAAASRPRLVVWPETAAPYFLSREPAVTAEISSLAASTGAPILVGALEVERGPERTTYFNRAFLVTASDGIASRYDKMHLVPFGEYVPLKRLLFFVEAIAAEIGDFTPGLRPLVFDGAGHRFGVVICYEGIFPELFREFVGGGAEFMVNITNDGWFGRTSGPIQHLTMMPFRAVENNVAVVRAANTGVSAIIGPSGEIRERLGLFERGQMVGRIPLRRGVTFYTRYGDVFAWTCLGVGVALTAWAGWNRRRRRKC
ncbi:MAG: apolipoprotein N-acyltransferase [Candidatus Rokubacteria bacterium]|nr:apolipoprotein N-acyltransferase [Candidatus Rokubacteria bacterium]